MLQTKKLKPYRIAWHVGGGLVIFFAALAFYPNRTAAVTGLAIASGALLAFDVFRFKTAAGRAFFERHLHFLAKKKDQGFFNTSTFYCISLLVCFVLFPMRIATASILCIALGDTAAVVVGTLFGRIRIGSKSLEGFLANVAVSYAAIFVHLRSNRLAAAGALAAAGIEMAPRLDDNIAIPLAASLAMYMASIL